MSSPIIAIVAPGAMGAAVARVLADSGCTVLTNVDDRTAKTVKRAEEAGMKHASYEEIVDTAEWVLSILPPVDAYSVAEKVVSAAKSRTQKREFFGYVDCNAISPKEVGRIAELCSSASIPFVDAAIIGGPPNKDYTPKFYASGTDPVILNRFFELSEHGLKISLLDGGVGSASALKMSYAGMTKGTTGLFMAMILAAHSHSPATSAALLNELNESQNAFLQRIGRVVPPALPKAYRWTDEMRFIAEFIGREEGQIYEGIANLYERVKDENSEEVVVLQDFVAQAGKVIRT